MDIFISYSSKDIEIVKSVCSSIRKNNFAYWVAHENHDFGEHYATTIITQISEAKIFLIFVSKSSNMSTHVINEINSAVMRDKLIIPVILDDVKLSPAMEYYLSSNHYLMYAPTEEFSSQLVNRISSLLGITTETTYDESVNSASPENDDLLQKAYLGEFEAMCELGRRYYNGSHGLTKNLSAAFACFMKAAEGNYPEAQCNVAWCYEVGDGVEGDMGKAFDWYLRSGNNNCAMAQYSLGWMYSEFG